MHPAQISPDAQTSSPSPARRSHLPATQSVSPAKSTCRFSLCTLAVQGPLDACLGWPRSHISISTNTRLVHRYVRNFAMFSPCFKRYVFLANTGEKLAPRTTSSCSASVRRGQRRRRRIGGKVPSCRRKQASSPSSSTAFAKSLRAPFRTITTSTRKESLSTTSWLYSLSSRSYPPPRKSKISISPSSRSSKA